MIHFSIQDVDNSFRETQCKCGHTKFKIKSVDIPADGAPAVQFNYACKMCGHLKSRVFGVFGKIFPDAEPPIAVEQIEENSDD